MPTVIANESLSILRCQPDKLETLTGAVSACMEEAFADSTIAKDNGFFKRWCDFCKDMDTSPWRCNHAANSGVDPEGHQKELLLQAIALIDFYIK